MTPQLFGLDGVFQVTPQGYAISGANTRIRTLAYGRLRRESYRKKRYSRTLTAVELATCIMRSTKSYQSDSKKRDFVALGLSVRIRRRAVSGNGDVKRTSGVVAV